MIHIQQEITNGLLVEYQYIKEETGCRKIAKGREVFRSIYYDFNSIIEFPDGKRSLVLSQALNVWPDLRMHLSKVEIMWNLDHYFRHLYRIFKSNSGDGSCVPSVASVTLRDAERFSV